MTGHLTNDGPEWTITVRSGTGQEMMCPEDGEAWMRHFVWAEAVGPTQAFVWQLTTTQAMRDREQVRAHLRQRAITHAVERLVALELPG